MGDIGPGGGLVFLVSEGLCYEMAPRTWSGGDQDPTASWCSDSSNNVVTSFIIGAGRSNTEAMLTDSAPFVACSSGAANDVRAYSGGGLTDWFLPSRDEMNAMCNYSRNPSSPLPPSEVCDGPVYPGTSQDSLFAASSFGFSASTYWTSSQSQTPYQSRYAWSQGLGTKGVRGNSNRSFNGWSVRPIRAYRS